MTKLCQYLGLFCALFLGLNSLITDSFANVLYTNTSTEAVHVLHLRVEVKRRFPPAETSFPPNPFSVSYTTEAVMPGQTYTSMVQFQYEDEVPSYFERTECFLESIDVIEAPVADPKIGLRLVASPAPASASLSASALSIVRGEAITLSLGQSLESASGRVLSGPGLPLGGVAEPPPALVVTPPSTGTNHYTYTVPGGYVQLTWTSNSPFGTFILNMPDGSIVDVTGVFYYNVTQPGAYTITQTNAAGAATSEVRKVTLPADAVAAVAVDVLQEPAAAQRAVSLRMEEAWEKVKAPGKPYDGKRFRRSWLEGQTWHAYLGRSGIRLLCEGVAKGGASEVLEAEIQVKNASATAEWEPLASGELLAKKGAKAGERAALFLVRLGEVVETNPLVPRSCAEGKPLLGTWLFRARSREAKGDWSDWTDSLPVVVDLPVVVKQESLRTLPPVGEDAAWFEPSPEKTFSLGLWLP